jgi:pSer/pThr/pTyr-binding forkhead associated (FHA) protein
MLFLCGELMDPMSAPRDTNLLRLAWDDPGTGEEFEWYGPTPVRLGRAPENEIVLNAAAVSRQHARIERDGGTLIVVDNGSGNGTFVGEQRVTRQTLADGSLLTIGPFTLTVDLDPPALGGIDAARQAARGGLRLRWASGDGIARELPLDRAVIIGRGDDCDIVLPTTSASRRHARIAPAGTGATITDQNSSNGTFVNDKRITERALAPGDVITIGGVSLTVEGNAPRASAEQEMATRIGVAAPVVAPAEGSTVLLDMPAALASARPANAFPPAIFDAQVVPIAALGATGLPIDETVYLAIGGGLGSFAWVDHLVVHGADPRGIVAIGLEDKPYGRYQRLCSQSQIPPHERLRSNSDSCPDNLWGWPGYAVRETFSSLAQGQFGNALQCTWQIFNEPTFSDTYTPRSGDVFRSIDREAARIGWERIWRYGRVRAIRKTDDGRYVIAYSQSTPQNPSAHRLIVARFVQVAVGYPGIKLLPDLQKYRQDTGDFSTVVNAYEEREAVYQGLLQRGGTVVVRGRGIVASRILQRLYELRQQNPRIGVLHLMRTPVAKGHRFGRAEREVINHWEYQPFNWPKSTWTGEMLGQLERASDQERDRLLNDWGGTTTAKRSDWVKIVDTGQREGWYQIRFGDVKEVRRGNDGKLITTLTGKGFIQDETDLKADYIIDCTGLESAVEAHPLLKDLITHHGLRKSPKGRLRVENDFALTGMENGQGQVYAAGAMTLGGPMAAVDSFLGLQYAALASVQSLARRRAPGVRRLNIITSPIQWIKWAMGAKP